MEAKIESIDGEFRESLIRADDLESKINQLKETCTGKLGKLEQDYEKKVKDLQQQLLVRRRFLGTKEAEKALISQWYDLLKPQIWVIIITGPPRADYQEVHLSGFAVDRELGLIMTCAHNWCQWDEKNEIEQIEVRRLGDIGFTTDVEVVLIEPQWDLAVLRLISGFREDCPVARLAQDGSLDAGETIFHIGHPVEFHGSCLIGSVAYKCVENVSLPQTKQMCKHYNVPPNSIDHGYRIYGHRWNLQRFKSIDETDEAFEKNLHPMVPIIQGYGLHCYTGSSGGAVFNLRGEVVGLASSIGWKFDIAVHVTLLRHFLKMAINKRTRDLVMDEDEGGSAA